MPGSTSHVFRAFALIACVAISGCKEVLYSDLTEVDANEMAAILEASGIESSRNRDKKGVYELWVDGSNVGAASTILKSQGLPRKRYKTTDEIFAAEGLVGSPFEERVRYMFALEEKLTENLVSIHGVRDARVTVSIPEKSRFGEETKPASAAVVLHHEEDFVVQDSIPKIKTLIASAIQGLDYSNVAVVVFPTGGTAISQIETSSFGVSAAHASLSDVQHKLTLNGSENWRSFMIKAFGGVLALLTVLLAWRFIGGRSRNGWQR